MKVTIQHIAMFCVMVITISIAYFFFVFLPDKEKARNQLVLKQDLVKQQQAEEVKKEKDKQRYLLDECLNRAWEHYDDTWKLNIGIFGSTDGNLPMWLADDIDQSLQDAEKLCLDKYK